MSRAARRLIAVLERERKLLLKGGLEDALLLASEKTRLIDRLGDDAASSAPEIRRLAARNADLIDAARRGVTAARTRLDAIRNGASVETYGANGARTTIGHPHGTLSRRA